MRSPDDGLRAVDLVTGKVLWQRPVGTTRDMGPAGLRSPIGLPTGISGMGGSIATRSGLLFMGATSDQYFRIFDAAKRFGRFICRPAAMRPLSLISEDGRQYVVIAAGGHGGIQSRDGDQVIAFALPHSAS